MVKDPYVFPLQMPEGYGWNEGITLRDYLAAKAMEAYLSQSFPMEVIPVWSYEIADKMLKERSKNNG